MVVESKQTIKDACAATEPVLSGRRFATGLLAVAILVFALIMRSQLTHGYLLEHNFHGGIDSPVLALELAGDERELRMVLGTEDPADVGPKTNPGLAIACLRTNTFEDFFFILLYTSFLWAFAGLFAIRADGSPMAHRWAIACLAVLTALFDCAENVGILRALGATHLSDSTAQAICWPSRCKWTVFGLALLLTGWLLTRSASPIYSLPSRRLLALAYGVAGALLMIGLMRPHVIEIAISVFAILIVIHVIGLLGPFVERSRLLRPEIPVYVEDFCNRKRQMRADVAVYSETTLGKRGETQ